MSQQESNQSQQGSGDKGKGMMEKAMEFLEGAKKKLSEYAQEAKEKAKDYTEEAKNKAGETSLLVPVESTEVGTVIKPKGTQIDLDDIVAPKILQGVLKHLSVGETGLAQYKNYPFVVGVKESHVKPENPALGPGTPIC